ncbi:lipoxygenase [Mycena floridula]|nr:lipoxygenase [Mycena floridula]
MTSSNTGMVPLSSRPVANIVTNFSLPFGPEYNTTERAKAIAATRLDFRYGPDIAGRPGANGSYYPEGTLAEVMKQAMTAELHSTHKPWVNYVVKAEGAAAVKSILKAGGFQTFDDYKKLYELCNWRITIPDGVAQGVLSNGTSDLLFAMDRLSIQPYSVRRLGPSETLSFTIDSDIAKNLANMTQEDLHAEGRLFYVDYRFLAKQTLVRGRYAGACDAFFFIHPVSGEFLPLAIRPNNGSPLVYTPLDSANDWQLAKLLFNQNDLCAEHPVFALMTRLAHQTFSIRLIAIDLLLAPGGYVDRIFSWNGSTAADFSSSVYHGGASKWQSNYFSTHLSDRGLIDSEFGPALKSFPFYSDANNITTSIRSFVNTFVGSYYTSETMIAEDHELQRFVLEAKEAKAIDFPTSLTKINELVEILTHFAYLGSVLHGTMNTNELAQTGLALPYHPVAFYAPLPATKGVTDLMPFMPNVTQAVQQIVLAGAFTRPFFAGGNMTLSEMFADQAMLDRMNPVTKEAAGDFKEKMKAFSKVVSGRSFDAHGLSQGMPFVWKVLDPMVTPFYSTI